MHLAIVRNVLEFYKWAMGISDPVATVNYNDWTNNFVFFYGSHVEKLFGRQIITVPLIQKFAENVFSLRCRKPVTNGAEPTDSR